MCTSAVPQEQRPSFCTQCLVLKLLEVGSFLVLELVEIFRLLLLLFIEHCGILEEVLMGGVTTIFYKQCTYTDTMASQAEVCCYAAGTNYYTKKCVWGGERNLGGWVGQKGRAA